MAEIEITLPTVQYGNVRARFSPEEFGLQPTDQLVDPTALGIAVAVYLNLFTQGFKAGSQMDVSAPVSAPQGALGPEPRTIDEVLSDEDVDTVAEAQAILDKGLGGVTEVSAAEAETTTQSAPWTEKVDAPKKPWETEVTAPAVLDASW